MAQADSTVKKFWNLSPSQQRRILKELKLIGRKGDEKYSSVPLALLAFVRAKEEGIAPALIEAINKESL